MDYPTFNNNNLNLLLLQSPCRRFRLSSYALFLPVQRFELGSRRPLLLAVTNSNPVNKRTWPRRGKKQMGALMRKRVVGGHSSTTTTFVPSANTATQDKIGTRSSP
ncbi:Uncharacterized protein Fot_06633 [Forsythia ovata]|uniref:Uncharacterized protein n=1 Tax=Forsythia ovata TaxID=205694 RepID=A0ABD1WTM3_9LAMI